MRDSSVLNTLILLLFVLAIAGGGYYLTQVWQPKELEKIEQQEKEARLRNVQVEQLLQEQSASKEQGEQILRRWKARYKVMPPEMQTWDIIEYLERLTSVGFETFNYDLTGVQRTPNFSVYKFRLDGTAFFRNLHDFVWHLENNREFYHVHDLSLSAVTVSDENPNTGRARQRDMVRFDMMLDAFFAGNEGLTPDEDELLPIPRSMLPIHYPAHNSFFPIVRTDLPPNELGLVDMDNARLVSIIGNRAIFEYEDAQYELSEGDDVYLGRIVKVDPINGFVRASLNRGGVIDLVEVKMDTDRNLPRGNVRLAPIQNP